MSGALGAQQKALSSILWAYCGFYHPSQPLLSGFKLELWLGQQPRGPRIEKERGFGARMRCVALEQASLFPGASQCPGAWAWAWVHLLPSIPVAQASCYVCLEGPV